ncbi:MAG: hypothetical protein AABX70_00345 [Nanoarchaeota archaeon]
MKLPNNYFTFFLYPILFGLLSFLLLWYIIHPQTPIEFKSHESLINTYALNMFVGWLFFSAFLLMRADEEWKKTDSAVRSKNFEKFKAEAPKMIAFSVRITHAITGIMAITAFYLFYYTNIVLAFVLVFGTSFLVTITTLTLWDLDDPLDGMIQVENVPANWMKAIKKGK